MNRTERFMGKVTCTDSCWLWNGSRSGSGYGQFWNGKRNIPAHWFLLESDKLHLLQSPGMEACHSCDNKLCVRPSHIFIGTRSDNMKDCVSKGRLRPRNGALVMLKVRKLRRGESNPAHKLTAKEVQQIRCTQLKRGTQAAMARAYGVSETVISGIIRGLRWRL